MDTNGLQTPAPNPSPPPPPVPAPVPVEQPQIIRPQRKKKGLKIAGGLLAVALLAGGLLVSSQLLKDRQKVEKIASAQCDADNQSECEAVDSFCTGNRLYECKWFDGENSCKKNDIGKCEDLNNCQSGSYVWCEGKAFGWTSECGTHWKEDYNPPFKYTCNDSNNDGLCLLGELTTEDCPDTSPPPAPTSCKNLSRSECAGCVDKFYECTWKDDSCHTTYNHSCRASGRIWGCNTRNSSARCSGKHDGDSCGDNGTCVAEGVNCEGGENTDLWADSNGNPAECGATNAEPKCKCETGESESSPSPSSPSPSPERQDICGTTGSTSIDKSSIAPGESATVTSTTGGTEVNKFSFAMYNRDNEYSPGNPKPICAAGSGGVQGDCPAGTHHLILADDDQTTMRTIGSKTFTYEDVFVADMNWGGETVNRIQINGYFQIDDGPVSLPNTRCVTYTSAGQALACVDLTKNVAVPKLNDTVAFTCEANFSGISPVAYFRFKHCPDTPSYCGYQEYPDAVPIDQTSHKATKNINIGWPDIWTVQCRVCTDNTKTSCTTWGQAN